MNDNKRLHIAPNIQRLGFHFTYLQATFPSVMPYRMASVFELEFEGDRMRTLWDSDVQTAACDTGPISVLTAGR